MFEFPSSPDDILRKKRALRRQLIAEFSSTGVKKKIAILGGSTTTEFIDCFELFLLNAGINPIFYESDYNKYYEDSVFGSQQLDDFSPDLIYIFTSIANVTEWPEAKQTQSEVEDLLSFEFNRLKNCWDKLNQRFDCPVIQNNFEMPFYRLLGNADFTDHRGRVNYVNSLNSRIAKESRERRGLYIHDLSYDAACFGLNSWHDRSVWHAYKFAFAIQAIPLVAKNVASQVGALFGRSKKCLVLDLDNTLWGGVIGDDGVAGIHLGAETPDGAAHVEFQRYASMLNERGVMLAVCSKNEFSNAIIGLNHQEGVLRPDKFECIIANWNPKSDNVVEIALQLNIGLDSLVFVDDNPAEREIVRMVHPQVAVPNVGQCIENFLSIIDRAGYFEAVSLSAEDLNRSLMYKENASREVFANTFEDYSNYLISLNMVAEISSFSAEYFDRIHQLINKTNQFNLTTKRCSLEEVIIWAKSNSRINLHGRLKDKFGDNGLVSILAAEVKGEVALVDIWVMSCRVFKRGMEFAMMENLIQIASNLGVRELRASYIKSSKNKMVEEILAEVGFVFERHLDSGESEWSRSLHASNVPPKYFIKVEPK
jgi:FkbH-like protein